jgi:hypothetical protein
LTYRCRQKTRLMLLTRGLRRFNRIKRDKLALRKEKSWIMAPGMICWDYKKHSFLIADIRLCDLLSYAWNWLPSFYGLELIKDDWVMGVQNALGYLGLHKNKLKTFDRCIVSSSENNLSSRQFNKNVTLLMFKSQGFSHRKDIWNVI